MRFGSGRAALRLATEALKHAGILRISRFVVLRPDCVDPAVYSRAVPYDRALLGAVEMRPYREQLPEQLSEDVLAEGAARDDRCYVILDGGTLASFGWYAIASARLFERELGFDRAFVYMYHGYTRPAYRGQRLHALGLAEATRVFASIGKKAVISTVSLTNYSSLKSIERLGFKCQGYIVQLGSGRLSAAFVTRGARAYGIRFGRRNSAASSPDP